MGWREAVMLANTSEENRAPAKKRIYTCKPSLPSGRLPAKLGSLLMKQSPEGGPGLITETLIHSAVDVELIRADVSSSITADHASPSIKPRVSPDCLSFLHINILSGCSFPTEQVYCLPKIRRQRAGRDAKDGLLLQGVSTQQQKPCQDNTL